MGAEGVSRGLEAAEGVEGVTGKRNVRPRHSTLKKGADIVLKKDERLAIYEGPNAGWAINFRAGTTGRVVIPRLANGNPVIETFLIDRGTLKYEVARSNVRLAPYRKPKPKAKPAGNCAPKGLDLLSPAERASLSPMAVKHLAASLINQRKAKRLMLEAIQTYADCTANVSHARRLARQDSNLE